MDVKFPFAHTLRSGDDFKVKVDVDSLYVISKNLKDDEVAEFADTIVSPKSTLKLKRYLIRTNGTDRTRFKVCLPKEEMYHFTRPKTKEKIKNINLEDCKNIVLFEVITGTIKFTVHYILLDGGYLNSRYLFNTQLAALASCMRMTQILGSYDHGSNTVYPTPRENVMNDGTLPGNLTVNKMTRKVYQEYQEVMRESELIEGISANSLIAKKKLNATTHNTLKATPARIFIRSFFKVLKNPEKALEALKEKNKEIKPWTSSFHKVDNSDMSEEAFMDICRTLSRKGIIMAQDPGTKNRFPMNEVDDQEHFEYVENGPDMHRPLVNDFIGDRINAKVAQLGQFMDPNKHKEDALRYATLDAHMHRFGRSESNVLRYFDYGIVIIPSTDNDLDMFIPTGPEGMYLMRSILNATRLQDNYDKGELIRQIFNVACDFDNVVVYDKLLELCNQNNSDGVTPTVLIDELLAHERECSGVNGDVDLQIINFLSTEAIEEGPGGQTDLADGEAIPHTADTLLKMLHKGYDLYPSFGTLGQCANIHTGKIKVHMVPTTVENDVNNDLGRVNIQYSLGDSNTAEEAPSTYFKGGQIYSPMWRKMSSQTAMKDLSSLSKFPECLKQYIWPLLEGLAPGNGVPHHILRTQTRAMFDRVTEAYNRFQENLNQFGGLPVRIELFTRYDPDRDYKVEEKISDLPDFLSVVRKYKINQVRSRLQEKSKKLYAPIKAIMDYDRDKHQDDARPPSFYAFGNREVLATVVMCAEQLNAVGGICWAGPYTKREQAKLPSIKEKLGGLSVRMMMLEDCDPITAERTKLKKKVKMDIMLQPQPDSFRAANKDFKGRLVPAWMFRQAENMKKQCHYPILYVATASRIERCLLQLSSDPSWDLSSTTDWCDWESVKYDVLAVMDLDKMNKLLQYLAKEMVKLYYQLSIWEMNKKQKKQEKDISISLTPEQKPKPFTEKTYPVTAKEFEEWDVTRQSNDSTKEYNFKFLKEKPRGGSNQEDNHQDTFFVMDYNSLFKKMFGLDNEVDTSHKKSPAWKIARDVEFVLTRLRQEAQAESAKENENATANLTLLQCHSHFKKEIAKELYTYAESRAGSQEESDSVEDSEGDERRTTPLILNSWQNRYRSEFGQLIPVLIYRNHLETSRIEQRRIDQSLPNPVLMESECSSFIAIQLHNMSKDGSCLASDSDDSDDNDDNDDNDETITRFSTTIHDKLPFASKHIDISPVIARVTKKCSIKLWSDLLRHKVAENFQFDLFILTRVYAHALYTSAREYYDCEATVDMLPQVCFTYAEIYSLMAEIKVHCNSGDVDLTMLWSCKKQLQDFLKNQIYTDKKTLCKAINAYIEDDQEYYRKNKSSALQNTVRTALGDVPRKSLRQWKYFQPKTNDVKPFSFWSDAVLLDCTDIGTYTDLKKNVCGVNHDTATSNTMYNGLASLLEHCVKINYLTPDCLWLVAQFRMSWDINDIAWLQWEKTKNNSQDEEDDNHKYLNRVLVGNAGFNLDHNSGDQSSKNFHKNKHYTQTIKSDKVKTEDNTTTPVYASPTKTRVQSQVKASLAFNKRKRGENSPT